jgi:hypothetical protein
LKIRGDSRKPRCTTGIKDTGGKFATGVNDTGSKLCVIKCWKIHWRRRLYEFFKILTIIVQDPFQKSSEG